MTDWVTESINDLLRSDSNSLLDSGSSKGSHHPSHECFMGDVEDGHVVDYDDADPDEVPAAVVASEARTPSPPTPVGATSSQLSPPVLE